MFARRAVSATRAAILKRFHRLAGHFCPMYINMEPRSIAENKELFQGPVVKFINHKESVDPADDALRAIDIAPAIKRDALEYTEELQIPTKDESLKEEHSTHNENDLESDDGDGAWRDDSYYRSLLGGTHLGGI